METIILRLVADRRRRMGRSVMNSSFYSLDRTTHLKILFVAAAMASLVLTVFTALS